MKKLQAISLITVLMGSLLAGCGSNENNKNSDAPEQVTLKYTGWLETSREGMEAVATKFEAENPNIKVEMEFLETSQYDQVYIARMASGEGSDMMSLRNDEVSKQNYESGGYYYDLNNQPFLSNIVDGITDGNVYNGKLQSVPVYGDVWGLWYNKDILNELNLEYPTSRSEFIEVANKVKEAGYQPISQGLKDSWNAWMSLWTFGWGKVGAADPEFFLKAQKGEVKFADNPDVAWGFEQMKEFYDLGFFSKDMLGTSWQKAQEVFYNGEAAFLPAGSWLLADLRKANPSFEIGFAKAPNSDEPQDDFVAQGGYGWSLGINPESKHVDEALKFMNFFFTPENYEIYCNAAQASGPVVKDVKVDFDPLVPEIQKAITGMNTDLHPGVAEDAAHNGAQALIGGQSTPEEIVKEMDKAIERAVKR